MDSTGIELFDQIDIENPLRHRVIINSSIVNRIDTEREDHTTRDSIFVAEVWNEVSKFIGLEIEDRTNFKAPIFIVCDLIKRCYIKQKENEENESKSKKKYNLFWRLLVDNEDYSLIRWFKITGFVFQEGGSIQPEDIYSSTDTPADVSHEKFIAYSNKFFNFFIIIKNLIFVVFGFIGFVAFSIAFGYASFYFIWKLTSTDISLSKILVSLGLGLVYLIAPTFQLISICWTLNTILSEFRCNSCDSRKHMNLSSMFNRLSSGRLDYEESKLDSFNFFYLTMTALLILMGWPALYNSPSQYFVAKGIVSIKIGYFISFCYYYIFMLNITQYLSICMFFISVSLKEIKKRQYELHNLLENNEEKVLKYDQDIISYIWSHVFKKVFSTLFDDVIYTVLKNSCMNDICIVDGIEYGLSAKSFDIFDKNHKWDKTWCCKKSERDLLSDLKSLFFGRVWSRDPWFGIFFAPSSNWFRVWFCAPAVFTFFVFYNFICWVFLICFKAVVLVLTCLVALVMAAILIGIVTTALVLRILFSCFISVEKSMKIIDYAKEDSLSKSSCIFKLQIIFYYSLFYLKCCSYTTVRDISWYEVQDNYSNLYEEFKNSKIIKNPEDLEYEEMNLYCSKTNLTVTKYETEYKQINSIIEARKKSINLILLSSLLNVFALGFLVWYFTFYNNESLYDRVCDIFPQIPFLVKELIVFFYILHKATWVNSAQDDFKNKLANKIVRFGKLPPTQIVQVRGNYMTSADVVRDLTVILSHASIYPLNFKFFGYTISRENWQIAFYSFLASAAYYIFYILDIIIKDKSLESL